MSQIGAPLVDSYDLRLVALSILIAVSASYAALDLGGRVTAARGWIRSGWLAAGAAAMGFGIWSMHFTGMLAMRLPAACHYSPLLVTLSFLIAIIASLAAMVFAFDYRDDLRGTTSAKVISAVAMGAAISLMHYTGIMSASFIASAVLPDMSHAVSISSLG